MVANAMTRRAAFAAVGVFALASIFAAPLASAEGRLRFREIRINVAPLRASAGDPTATWMDDELRRALPEVLGPYLAPGDRNAGVLEVRIDYVYLGPSSGGTGPGNSAQDTVVGTFIVRGPRGGVVSQIPLRAIASYFPSATDQALVEEAYHGRVAALAQAFAGWAPRELGL
jgi:hypothetical protein